MQNNVKLSAGTQIWQFTLHIYNVIIQNMIYWLIQNSILEQLSAVIQTHHIGINDWELIYRRHWQRISNYKAIQLMATVCLTARCYQTKRVLSNTFLHHRWFLSYIDSKLFHIFHLTHWGRDKMDAFSQTTFWSAFSWIEMFDLRLKFHWSLFLMVQMTIFQHWSR